MMGKDTNMIECGSDNGPEATTGDLHLRVIIEADGVINADGMSVPLDSKDLGCRLIRVADNKNATQVDLDRAVAAMLHDVADELYPLDTKEK